MEKAWLFVRGSWTEVDDPYHAALEKLKDASEKEDIDITRETGFVQFERLGGRAALFEWAKEGLPNPAQYLVRFGIGVSWYNIYVNDLPDLIHLLSVIASIERTWPTEFDMTSH